MTLINSTKPDEIGKEGRKKVRYYLHIPLPEDLKEVVSCYQERYGEIGKSEPHITLMIPREFKLKGLGCETALVAGLCRAAKELSPFAIRLSRPGYFGDYAVVYVAVERTEQLLRCHEILSGTCDQFLRVAEGEFVHIPQPHISLFTGLASTKGRELFDQVRDQDFSGFSFLCREVCLLRREEGDRSWVVAASINLEP